MVSTKTAIRSGKNNRKTWHGKVANPSVKPNQKRTKLLSQ